MKKYKEICRGVGYAPVFRTAGASAQPWAEDAPGIDGLFIT